MGIDLLRTPTLFLPIRPGKRHLRYPCVSNHVKRVRLGEERLTSQVLSTKLLPSCFIDLGSGAVNRPRRARRLGFTRGIAGYVLVGLKFSRGGGATPSTAAARRSSKLWRGARFDGRHRCDAPACKGQRHIKRMATSRPITIGGCWAVLS